MLYDYFHTTVINLYAINYSLNNRFYCYFSLLSHHLPSLSSLSPLLSLFLSDDDDDDNGRAGCVFPHVGLNMGKDVGAIEGLGVVGANDGLDVGAMDGLDVGAVDSAMEGLDVAQLMGSMWVLLMDSTWAQWMD